MTCEPWHSFVIDADRIFASDDQANATFARRAMRSLVASEPEAVLASGAPDAVAFASFFNAAKAWALRDGYEARERMVDLANAARRILTDAINENEIKAKRLAQRSTLGAAASLPSDDA